MTFPAPVPEIPAASVDKAAAYYVNTLGFTFDWGDDQGGIAGISRGNCRLFITNRSFRESYGNIGPILFWLNLDSKAEVDELFAEWKAAHANIVSEPEDKPWKLREFMAADLDGNLIRVFYDFRGDIYRTTIAQTSRDQQELTNRRGRRCARSTWAVMITMATIALLLMCRMPRV
jgi:uncharacterized glyoxalase superfamily protein PhnB